MKRRDRQDGPRQLEQYELDAYELGRQIALNRRIKRTSATRREVQLDQYGNPIRIVEETVHIEELDY